MACAICETRKPRRFCPGVRGDICTICCGQEREVTVDCPLDCEYLREARLHEKRPDIEPDKFPNQDIRLTDKFINDNEHVLLFVARALCEAALGTQGTVDTDVREALDSLIRTYRTLQSGLVYETRPNNPFAAQVHVLVQAAISEMKQAETQQGGFSRVRDAEILGVLVFLQRLELDRNNGRRRGRAFIDMLRNFFPPQPAEQPSGLVLA
jgi:hypothetical protein